MKTNTLTTLILIYTASTTAQTEIFHWEDANGTLHFSDKAPQNHDYQSIQEKSAQSVPTLPIVTSPRHLNDTINSHPEKTKQSLSPPQADARTCATMLIELDTIKRTEAVFKDNNNQLHTHRSAFSKLYQGDRYYIDDKERKNLTAQMELQFKNRCNDSPESQRERGQALAKLTKSKDCKLLNIRYKDRQHPKRRTADSDLKLMRETINNYCNSADNSLPRGISKNRSATEGNQK